MAENGVTDIHASMKSYISNRFSEKTDEMNAARIALDNIMPNLNLWQTEYNTALRLKKQGKNPSNLGKAKDNLAKFSIMQYRNDAAESNAISARCDIAHEAAFLGISLNA